MKIATLAVLATSLFSFTVPSFAEVRMVHHHRSHMMMHRHHRMMSSMGGTGGKMAAHRNF